MIVDEIQTGVGRTGRMWAFEDHSTIPDIVVISKAVGGGQPLALIVYRAELDIWGPGEVTGTFRGSGLSLAAGAATLRTIREEGLVQRAAACGQTMAANLRELAASSPLLGAVSGSGLLLGIEALDRHTGERDAEAAAALQSEAFEAGLLIERGGADRAVLRFLPPLTITDAEAEEAVERLACATHLVARGRAA